MPSQSPKITSNRTTVLRSSFNGGVISPLMVGRSDFSKYKDSCTELKNFIPWITGAVKKRAGSKYVHDCKYHDKVTRLIPFKFNEYQNFIIEFGHNYFRFHANGTVIKSGGIPYELAHTIPESDINDYTVIHSGDYLMFVHPDNSPKKLVRGVTNTNWSFSTLTFTGLGTWGNPAAICFFENRLWIAGSNANPQGLAASKTADYFNFDTTGTVEDDSSLRFTLNSSNNNKIKWLFSGRDLIVGTTGDEFILTGGDTGVTPFNVSVKTYTSYGCTHVSPLKIDDKLLFAQTGGTVVREFNYALVSDSYKATDATILADHITHSGIKEMAYQQQPNRTVWVLMNDGRMAGMVRNEEHNVLAWFEVATNGLYKSVAVIPDWNNSREDVLWNVVERYVDGETKQMIEYTPSYGYDEHAVFADSSLTYDGSPTNNVTGLEHLEGEKVAIYADGGVVPSQTVVNGELDFGLKSYSVIVAGLPYDAVLTTTPLEIGDINDTAQGYKSKVISCIFKLDRSAFEIHYSWLTQGKHEWEVEVFRVIGDTELNQNDKLFTGNTDNLHFIGSQQSSLQIGVKHNKPGPFTLLAMMATIQITSI